MKKLAAIQVRDIKLPKNYFINSTGITQGLVADFATCRQRFLYRINGWRSADNQSEALFFGSLVHFLLEKFYTSKSKFFFVVIPKLIREYVGDKEIDPVLLLKAEALMHVYCQVFAKDREKIFPIRTEEVFQVEALGAMLRGRKDLVYQYKTGKKWMMEHKTKSYIDHDFLGYQLSHDIQNLFYDLSEEVPFVGITYNILRRPQQRPKKNENGKQFLTRLKQEIQERSSEYFFRYEVTFTKQDRERFKDELQLKIFEMQEYLKGKLAHYRNEAACQTPYRCQYLKACTSGFMTGYDKSNIIFPELEVDAK